MYELWRAQARRDPLMNFIAFTGVTVACSVVTYPLIKIQRRLVTKQGAGVVDVVSNIYKKEGILGFFEGSMATVASIITSHGLFYIGKQIIQSYRLNK
jgi:hypothetical protein